jgi:hypothetical protein
MTVSGWIWTEVGSEEEYDPLLIIYAERRGERPERPADDTEGMAKRHRPAPLRSPVEGE